MNTKLWLVFFLSVLVVMVACAPTPPAIAPPVVPSVQPPAQPPTVQPTPVPPSATTKSDVELCMEKGWVWTRFASGTGQCLPPSTVAAPTVAPATWTPLPTPTKWPTVTPAPPTTVQAGFHLLNRHTQMCLSAQSGTFWIVQEPCRSNALEQLWRLASPGIQISLQTLTNRCVGYNNENNKLVQVGCSGSTPWKLVPSYGQQIQLPHAHPTTPPRNIQYYLVSMVDGECVDDDGWSHAQGQVQIHDTCRWENNDNQLWGPY